MPLPILHATSQVTPETLVRLFHKTELHWTQHLAEETQLAAGSAFTNPDLPNVYDANRVLGASVAPGTSVDQTIKEVEAHFASRNVRCSSWITNPSAPEDQA